MKTRIKNKQLIIHISGASGSGKTYLGKKIAKTNGNNVIVKDLDSLRSEFHTQHDETNITVNDFINKYNRLYQQFIDGFIMDNNSKPIVFVGLNVYIVGESFNFKNKHVKYPRHFFDIHADYKFYLKVDTNTILKRHYYREFDGHIGWFCEWIRQRKDILFNNLLDDETQAKKDICVALTRPMNFKQMKKNIIKWNVFYVRRKNYVYLSPEKVYVKINNIIKQK